MLAEIHRLMEVRAKQKNLPVILRYDGIVPENIITDRTRLRQIVMNLVSNAVKFTKDGGVEIVTRFSKDSHLLRIEVIDTGIGISQAQQARLFEPFTQADSTSTREHGGTGLGLAITKRLVEMLEGSISVESEPQKGSTFRVTIPAAPVQAVSTSVKADTTADRAGTEEHPLDCHVLVVDDREEIRFLISHFIKRAGGRATSVGDGESAIRAIRSAEECDPVEVVIMDIQMPRVDGYAVTRQLRAEGFQRPIIALTANAMKGDREKCLEAGCDDYISKPIDRQALVQLVAHYAAQSIRFPAAAEAKLKVLLVDDSQAACELMRRFLAKRGHEVRAAHEGKAALPLAQEFRPDVVVLDIRLPDMNGYELLRRLKETDGIGKATFISVSGYRDDDAPGKGSVEFDHFLEKPLDMAQLDAALRSRSSSATASA
ncbi:MAG: response regulator [Candidatus Binatia bacterium]